MLLTANNLYTLEQLKNIMIIPHQESLVQLTLTCLKSVFDSVQKDLRADANKENILDKVKTATRYKIIVSDLCSIIYVAINNSRGKSENRTPDVEPYTINAKMSVILLICGICCTKDITS